MESTELKQRRNDTKIAIKVNQKLEENLHIIMVISNPCEYRRRWFLAKEFIKHIQDNRDASLYIVEMAYCLHDTYQEYHITEAGNPTHLQLKATVPLWHKENMIDLAIQKLLPHDWKAVAWIDADLEFENPNWASDALKILNGSKDFIQLFSHCLDMDHDENTMQVFHGFGYQYETGKQYFASGINYWHPGFAWAMTRKCYEKVGEIFPWGILGAGDYHMALALIGVSNTIHLDSSEGYKKKLEELTKKSRNIRMGYCPGVIRHFFHGSKKNRKYMERWQILIKHEYDPFMHMTLDENGVIIPSPECPLELLQDIMHYFGERKEDD